MKNKLILFLINLFFIYFLFAFISAEESINADYPKEVNALEEFVINIELDGFEDDLYDVKIDFMKDGKRVSKIWNGNSWQSTFKYLTDAIDTSSSSKEQFRINISEEILGNVNMELKIRNSKNKVASFLDYTIEVVKNNKDSSTNRENEEDNIGDTNQLIKKIENEAIDEPTSIKISNDKKNKSYESEDINRYGYVIYESKSEKIKKYAIFFFALQCVILAILVDFKRIN